MTVERIEGEFTVAQVREVSPELLKAEFCFVGKTDGELSLVCPSELTPEHTLAREDGWRGFRLVGVLDFSLIGILARIASLLAEAGISIFALSTYNTDYVLVKKERFEEAMDVLRSAGYMIM